MYSNSLAISRKSLKWFEPRDLPSIVKQVSKLDSELLPQAFRDWLTDASERMCVPLEMLAAPAIVALSIVIGRRAAIQPKRKDNSWLEIPNLWGAIIASPGSLKSPCMSEAFSPIKYIEKILLDKFISTEAERGAEDFMLDTEIQSVREKIKENIKLKPLNLNSKEELKQKFIDLENLRSEKVLRKPRLVVQDCTIEKLVEIHRDNPKGLLLYRDELMGFLMRLDQEGHEVDRAFYLEAWSGNQRHTSDRIKRGSIAVDALCLSIFGTIQPGPLSRYFASILEGKSDDGFLGRFQILIFPDRINKKWVNVDRHKDEKAANEALNVYQQLFNLKSEQFGAEKRGDLNVFRFSQEAQCLFDEWRSELENRLQHDEELLEAPAFASHLSKFRKLMPSLALIFYLVECVSDHKTGSGVSLMATKLAAAWCGFLEEHAKKVYAGVISPNLHSSLALLKRIKSGEIQDGMSVRDIYRKGWSGLTTSKLVEGGLSVLADHHWVKLEEIRQDIGAPKEIVRINPKVSEKEIK